eukprot:365883-Chlamydomonas_euryale.AAC.1
MQLLTGVAPYAAFHWRRLACLVPTLYAGGPQTRQGAVDTAAEGHREHSRKVRCCAAACQQ